MRAQLTDRWPDVLISIKKKSSRYPSSRWLLHPFGLWEFWEFSISLLTIWNYYRNFSIARLWRILLTRMQIEISWGFIKIMKLWRKKLFKILWMITQMYYAGSIKWKLRSFLLLYCYGNIELSFALWQLIFAAYITNSDEIYIFI